MRSPPHLSPGCLVLFLVALFSGGCASHLPPLSSSGQAFTPASDEALLWERAAREHRKLSVSSGLLRDPLLEEYLMDVAHRLLPPGTLDAGVSPSIHVLINPSLNAFAYPTGAIYVHSGLLARLENEAQLATVLAHEIAHVVHRHAIRHLRQERNKDLWKRIVVVTAPLVLGPLLAPLGVSVGGANPVILLQRPSVEYFLSDQALDSSLDLAARRPARGRFDQTIALFARTQPQLALLASVQSYQPSLMEEADRFAVTALGRAGYDPRKRTVPWSDCMRPLALRSRKNLSGGGDQRCTRRDGTRYKKPSRHSLRPRMAVCSRCRAWIDTRSVFGSYCVKTLWWS